MISHFFRLHSFLTANTGLTPGIELFGIQAVSTEIFAQLKLRQAGRFKDGSKPASADHLPESGVSSGTLLPWWLAILRQTYIDTSLPPSRRQTSATVRFSGGSNILSNAASRSGEKYVTTYLFTALGALLRVNPETRQLS
jgi:hypothetical protein